MFLYIGWGISMFTAVSARDSLFLCYYLLINVLFSIRTTVNLLLPYSVFNGLWILCSMNCLFRFIVHFGGDVCLLKYSLNICFYNILFP